MGKRVVILVDGSNLYLSAKRFKARIWPPDLSTMLTSFIDGDIEPVIKVHLFTSIDPKNGAQQRAVNKMEHSGVIVHRFDLKVYPDNVRCKRCNIICPVCGRDLRFKPHNEKMIDIALATKMIELACVKEPEPYDSFIIVSGDKDLIPAIRFIRGHIGKEVLVAGFRHKDANMNSLAYEMDREVDKIINLTKLMGLNHATAPKGQGT